MLSPLYPLYGYNLHLKGLSAGTRGLNGSQASQGPQHVAQPCIAAQIHEATGDVAPGAAQGVQLGAQVLLGGR